MLRIITFLLGVTFFVAGMASRRGSALIPIDLASFSFAIGFVSVSLDTIIMVVGVFFMVAAGVFHKLFSGTV